jgi:hypothetical protein
MTDTIEQGRLAEEIINNPVYQDAFAGIERELYTQWQASGSKDERETLHQTACLLKKLKLSLNETMLNGRVDLKVWQKKSMMERLTG